MLNEKELLETLKPKISVIIPVYNGEKYLHYSLRSVQNQKMKEIEIIIVDDKSNDNSIKIIKNYMEKDKRIKLIENKVNKKILFCKSLGALNSKGKYIIELDQDDMFIRDDAFDIVYNESEKYDIDLLSFGFISEKKVYKKVKKINNFVKDKNIIINQPILKYTMFKTNNCLLWGHLINSNLYKKVIYHLWPIIINYKIIFQEDYLISFFIFIYAQKFKKINIIILFHFNNKESTSKDYENNPEYFLSLIFAGIIYFDYYVDYNPNDVQIIMNYIYFLKNHFKKAKEFEYSLFNYFFGKILTSDYLSIKDKKKVMRTFKISDNLHSFKYFNKSQEMFFSEIKNNEKSIYKQNKYLVKLSIIFVCTNYENLQYSFILIFDNDNEKAYNI